MAKRCARLAVLAFAAARGAGAQDQDAVALVQHKLESQSALEDMPSDDVATVMSSFINMLKFENLIRESVFSEDAAATTKRVNFARDIPDEDVPPFKMPESIMHESKMPKSKAAAVESVQAEGTLGSGYWNIAKGKTLSQAVMTRAGESCSSQDLARMHKALEDYRHLAEEKGPTSIQYAIHPICKEALGLVINYTKFDTCVQKTLEVSPGCSKCHVNVMKGSMASDIFHPKCSLMCMNARKRRRKHVGTCGPDAKCSLQDRQSRRQLFQGDPYSSHPVQAASGRPDTKGSFMQEVSDAVWEPPMVLLPRAVRGANAQLAFSQRPSQ